MKLGIGSSALRALCASALVALGVPAWAQQAKPIKLGFVTFVTGPAADTWGVPAKIAAEALVESLNAGSVPSPHNTRGFGGTPLELVVIDEAGSAAEQVGQYRDLVERHGVDYVIGYSSSDNCLAIAPVAEEMKKLTVLFDCGTPRVFEEASYKYVFRTRPHATMDAVGAAHYLLEPKASVESYAGINPDSAWGADSWTYFSSAMHVLVPKAQIATSQLTQVGASEFDLQVSALLSANANVIHSSLWGGDLEAFLAQAAPRGLSQKSELLLVAGEPLLHRQGAAIPDGTIVGARGTHGVLAPDSPLNTWLKNIYKSKTLSDPPYPAYSAALSVLGLKAAYEAAKLKKLSSSIPMGENKGVKEEMEKAYNQGPSAEEVSAAFEGLSFQSPSGRMRMALGKGHQAISGTAYGTAKLVNGQVTLVNVRHYPVERVQPPEGVKSLDWIKSGMKAKK